jgi:predicted AAA+ superfamily ATPase
MSIFDIISDVARTVASATTTAAEAVASAATVAAKETASAAVEVATTTYDTAKAASEAVDKMEKDAYNAVIDAVKAVATPTIKEIYGKDGVKQAHELLDKAKV